MHTDPISNVPVTANTPAQDPTTFSASVESAQTHDLNIANATRPLNMPLLPDNGATVQTTLTANMRDEFQTQTRAQIGGKKLNLNLGYDHNITPTISEWANKSGPQYASASLDYRITDETAVGVGQRRRLENNNNRQLTHKPTYTEAHVTHAGKNHIIRAEVYIDPKLDHGVRFSSANTSQNGPRYQLTLDGSRDKKTDILASKPNPTAGIMSGSDYTGTSNTIENQHSMAATFDVPIGDYIRLGVNGAISERRDVSHTHIDYTASSLTKDDALIDRENVVQYGAYIESGFLPDDNTIVRVHLQHTTEAASYQLNSIINAPYIAPVNIDDFDSRSSVQLGIGVHGCNTTGTVAYSFEMGADTRLVGSSATLSNPMTAGGAPGIIRGFMFTDVMYIKAKATVTIGGQPKPQP